MVAEFVAPDSGELFFHVNDAVQILPGFLRRVLPARYADYFGPDDPILQEWHGADYRPAAAGARHAGVLAGEQIV